MVLNQIVLEFLGQELVIILMYGFWLMLGLVLFNSFKELYDFLKAIVLGVWAGLKWTGLKIWLGLRLVWQGLTWVFSYLKRAFLWIGKQFARLWKVLVKVAKQVGLVIKKVLITIGDWIKIAIQFSWWILAGVAIAIYETFSLAFITIAQTLYLGMQYLGIGLKWFVYPFFVLHQWLVTIQKGKKLRYVFKPWWIETIKWFKLQWRNLIFKKAKRPNKTAKAVPLTRSGKDLKAEPKVANEALSIHSLQDVNEARVATVKAAFAREEALDDVSTTKEAKAFESRTIFNSSITINPEFYQRLNQPLQGEFAQLFTSNNPNRLIQEVTYSIGGENENFFKRVFNYIYRVRKTLSLKLLQALVDEGLSLAKGDPKSQTNIYEAGIRVAYARRTHASFLTYAKALAEADVALSLNTLNLQHQYVYSVKRLAIILEKQEAYVDAIKLVNRALQSNLTDQTQGDYPERLKRLHAQQLIMDAKNQGLFVEQVRLPETNLHGNGNDNDEEVEVDNKTIDLSSVQIQASSFYESLSNELKVEFDRYFVHDGEDHLVKSLRFVPNEDNKAFFQNVFNSLYAYRRLISLDLLNAIYEELKQQLVNQPQLLTAVNEATIRILFYRRKDRAFLDACENLCQEDIALHLNVLKTRSGFVYSFKRLAILLEKQGLYDDAIAMCERAVNLNLDDKTQGGYVARKMRIVKRQTLQDKVGS